MVVERREEERKGRGEVERGEREVNKSEVAKK